jgi:hypothetical protein
MENAQAEMRVGGAETPLAHRLCETTDCPIIVGFIVVQPKVPLTT